MPTHHPKIDLPYPVDVGTGRRPQRESVLTPPRQAYSYILRPAGGGQIIRGSSQSDESQLRLRALSSRPPIVGSEAATKGTRLLNTAATKGTQPVCGFYGIDNIRGGANCRCSALAGAGNGSFQRVWCGSQRLHPLRSWVCHSLQWRLSCCCHTLSPQGVLPRDCLLCARAVANGLQDMRNRIYP
eukprot:6043427-Pyramimonas_sp.AAC.1